jgi:hypothetical protein
MVVRRIGLWATAHPPPKIQESQGLEKSAKQILHFWCCTGNKNLQVHFRKDTST